MVAPVVTMIWNIFLHVNTFDKITLTDSDLSLIYVQIILYTSSWVKQNLKWNKAKFWSLSIKML